MKPVKPRRAPRPPRLLFADAADGRVYDHPHLCALARDGVGDEPDAEPVAPLAEAEIIPLPPQGKFVALPGRRPVALDPETGAIEVVERVRIGRREVRALAVGALLPPGYARARLPAAALEGHGAPVLPQWAYTACGQGARGPVVAAMRIDPRTHWDPRRFGTPELPGLVAARCAASPDNAVLRQIATCALTYGCVTAQNTFYGRWEGALPVSSKCNADCVTCISLQPRGDGGPASHERIKRPMEAEGLAEVAAAHLATAERPLISFGQGCEGEPTVRDGIMARAMALTRERTKRGRINVNTNGSRPDAVARLIEAGLGSIRVSLNSAIPERYAHQYRPIGYDLADVRRTIALAARAGIWTSINLLTVPGVTDSEPEVAALEALVAETGLHMVQVRDLAVDMDLYLAQLPRPVGRPLGLRTLIERLRRARPGLVVGSYNVAEEEEARLRARAHKTRDASVA